MSRLAIGELPTPDGPATCAKGVHLVEWSLIEIRVGDGKGGLLDTPPTYERAETCANCDFRVEPGIPVCAAPAPCPDCKPGCSSCTAMVACARDLPCAEHADPAREGLPQPR